MNLRALHGAELAPLLDTVAALRIAVFRDWPYLYDGSLAYERDYLGRYLRCPQSVVGIAEVDGRIVGATTALPLEAAPEAMQAPFRARGDATGAIFYLGESVLLPDYRGRGIGKAFFALREARARELGHTHCTFCAVERPDDHPLQPAGHAGNAALWGKMGYQRQPSLRCQFEWQDLGEPAPSLKTLVFWTRTL